MPTHDCLARIAIVLSHPSHPGNIGAAARAMRTMGFGDLRLVAPRCFPDPQATALATGAVDILERARLSGRLEEAIGDTVFAVGLSARVRDLSHAPRALREAAPAILAAAARGTVALVFGNETFGLTNAELGRCRMLVTIPTDPAHPSLNLAAAVQVACYELASASEAFAPREPAARLPATTEDTEALLAHWESAMVESGYLDPLRPGRLMERLRRLVARAALERSEAKLLRGMLAAFQARMRR